MRKFLLLLLTLMASATIVAFGQSKEVKGRVIYQDGSPVAGGLVVLKGTSTGTMTDGSGNYTIYASDNTVLVFSVTGAKTVEEPVGSKTRINVTMHQEDYAMADVVVTAYGTTEREALTGSVSSIKGGALRDQQGSSVSKALEGTVSGVQLSSYSGRPGEDSDILIRGIGTINAGSSALIVVDGAPYNGKMSDINPNDITEITVSKDATSNSLYGSRAANGVIFITTKRGKANTSVVSVKAVVGMNTRAVPEYDIVTDKGEFYELTWESLKNQSHKKGSSLDDAKQFATKNVLPELGKYNGYKIPDGENLIGLDGKLNPNAKLLYGDYMKDALLQDYGLRQEYNVDYSGGSDNTTYFVSAGYLNDESYVVNSRFERMSIRANVESNVKKWLKLGTNISYAKVNSNYVNESDTQVSSTISQSRRWAPIYPVFAHDADGAIRYNDDGSKMYDLGNGETPGTERASTKGLSPLMVLMEDIRKDSHDLIKTRFFAEAKFLKHFKASADFSYDNRRQTYKEFTSPNTFDGKSVNGRLQRHEYKHNTINFNQIISYNQTFGDHKVGAMAGHEFYSYDTNWTRVRKTNAYDYKNPNFVNVGEMEDITEGGAEHALDAYFAKVDYNYDDRYYANASIRHEGSSRFVNNRWGTFWSVGGAWRISQESFMVETKSWLNELKLRASYGSQGNETVMMGATTLELNSHRIQQNYYPGSDLYSTTYNNWGWELSPYPDTYGNPDLSWETQTMFDVGLEFRMFDNRLSGSFDFYIRSTDDMLYRRTLPESAGRPYNWENLGKMRNVGIELDLSYAIFAKSDFNWTVGLNLTHVKNKVIKLPAEVAGKNPFINGITETTHKIVEGHSMYTWFIPIYAGVNPESGNPVWMTYDYEEGSSNPARDPNGNIEWKTTETYGNARKVMSDKTAIPDLMGGVNTSLFYKGIDFSLTTSFQIGGWVYDSAYADLMGTSYLDIGKHKDLFKSWNVETNATENQIPVFSTIMDASGAVSNGMQSSTRFLTKASYFSIRNITLGYTLPSKWMDKAGIQSLRVYIACDNVAFFSARKGFDPRLMGSGKQKAHAYSPIRTASLGLNVNF